MKKKTLTICIPTYNNQFILYKEVTDYLSIQDERLCIKISDNASTDNTFEICRSLIEKNENVIYQRNNTNLGPAPNYLLALKGAPSDYVLFVIDKDLVNIEELPAFIDYLETERPNFGYVDLDINKPKENIRIKSGIENVLKMAYLGKHPSGYFYRTDLFEKALISESYTKVDPKFEFPFEVINGELAVSYDSTIIVRPVIINATIRTDVDHLKKPFKTLSYDNTNIWYGTPKRIIGFNYYIDNALHLDLSILEKKKIAEYLTNKSIAQVTAGLRNAMRQKATCEHYNVLLRIVHFPEMYGNMLIILSDFRKQAIGILPTFVIWKICIKCYLIGILRMVKIILKDFLQKPQQRPLSV